MTFKPSKPVKARDHHTNVALKAELYQRISDRAFKHGTTVARFVREALEYALDNMEEG